MKFKRVTVTLYEGHPSNDVVGKTEYDIVYVGNDITLSTYDEDKTHIGENQMWVMDKNGDEVLVWLIDVRFNGIWADIMRFTGYLASPYKKFKKGIRVNINVWGYYED